MSTADKLNALILTKADIKLALIDKGVEVNDVFSTYAEAITNLSTGSGSSSGGVFDFAAIGYTGNEETLKTDLATAKEIYDNWDPATTTAVNKFKGFTGIFIPAIDTSNVTDMTDMFRSCKSRVYPTYLNTSKVTNMNNMFYQSLTLVVPSMDTSNVTNMAGMLDNCSVTSVDLNTDNVTTMFGMFNYCSKLSSVKLSSTSKVTNMNNMFYSCTSLLDVPAMDTSNVTTMKNMFSSTRYIKRINSISVKSETSHTNTYDYLIGYYTMSALSYFLIKDLGTPQSDKGWNFSYFSVWGINDDYNPDARQSLIDSLITYSFDRTAAGFSPITITLSTNTKALLTEDEIAQITAKGFTIA